MKKQTIERYRFSVIHYILRVVLSWCFVVSQVGVVFSAPQGAQVVNGNVSISQSGSVTTIHASNNSIINYQSFDIQRQETVQFVQPGSTARVLNRITSQFPTNINGALLANGQVYISNPAGIYFGPDAYINVGRLVAAAGTITNADFLNNIDQFTDINGDVINWGTVESDLVQLIGKEVGNHGVVLAEKGLISLVAGDDVLLGERDGHIFVKISQVAAKHDANNPDSPDFSSNDTDNRIAEPASLGAGDMYSLAIRNTGTLRAEEISLEGGDNSVVDVSGTLDASGTNPGGVGGRVAILGNDINLKNATIDASGNNGGGTVLVGGDHQGQGGVRKAARTTVDNNTEITVDAKIDGGGGEVVVWSEEVTQFSGKISARGGSQGGDGGLVETSSKDVLSVIEGQVDASAEAGTGGTWLLDPRNVTIEDAATSGGAFDNGDPNTFTPTSDDAVVNRNAIELSLNGGTSVTVATTNVGTQDGNISVVDSITKSAGGDATLTFDAENDIIIDSSITSSVGALNVTLNATNTIDINAAITTNGGGFNATGTDFDNNGGTITTSNGDVNLTLEGSAQVISTIDAGAGDVTINVGNAGAGSISAINAVLSTGTVTIAGSSGNDIINAAAITVPVSIAGNDGDDIIISGSGNDIVDGGIGNDTLTGGPGNDTLNGGPGDNDNSFGGTGDDQFVWNEGDGSEFINGDADSDSLTINSATVTDVTHTFDNATDGQIDFDGNTISYTNLEPITDALDATNRVFTFNGGAETINLSDDINADDGFSFIDSTLGEAVTFANPTGSLTVNAGSGDDVVTIDAMDSTFDASLAVNGDDASDVITVNAVAGSAGFAINGGAGDDSIAVNTALNGGSIIDGSDGNDTLVGGNDSDTITVTAPGAGIATGANANFSNIENIDLAGGDDLIILAGGTLAGGVDGGAGSDTFTGDDVPNTVTITGADSGTVTGVGAGFTSIENINGGSDDDAFTMLDGGSITGTINAGAQNVADSFDVSAVVDPVVVNLSTVTGFESVAGDGINDSLVGSNTGSDWQVTGVNSGTVDGADFTGFSSLTGGTGDDGFTLSGGTLDGALDGGDGSDSLTGDNVANTFEITGVNSGTATGVVGGFSNIENLDGGSDDDTFVFADGGSIDGIVDGGAETSADEFDVSAVTAAVTIDLANLTNIESVVGDGINDSLIGGSTGNNWQITGVNAGTVGGIGFSGFSSVTGGIGDDSFTLNGGALDGTLGGGGGNDSLTGDNGVNTFVITGVNSGTATGLAGGFNTVENITGGIDADSLTLNGGTLSGTFDGAAGNDTLTVDNGANTITITGADSGTVTGIGSGFGNIENITGGTDADSITLNGGTLSGALDGGAGNDTLAVDNVANTIEITGVDSGTTTGIAGGFSNIENLTGGSDTDSITLNGGTLSGVLDGGAGDDTLTADNVANTITISGADSGTVTGIDGGFSAIENVTGGADTDSITLNGGTLSGALNGGAGDDTLTADNGLNTIQITGTDSGTVTGVGGGFSAIENLSGGSDSDSVTISGGTLTGALDGGDGNDTLTTDNVANTITITGVDSGTVTGVGGGFSNIENLTGGSDTDSVILNGGTLSDALDGGAGDDTLTGDNVANTVTITGADSGTTTGVGGGFSAIENLIGGSDADNITLIGGTLSGVLNGGDGNDTLTADDVANTVQITGTNSGTATGVAGGFDSIENINSGSEADSFTLNGGTLAGALDGGDGSDTLTADDVVNTFEITGTNAGTATGVGGGFSNIENINGGSDDDTFVFADGGSIDGVVDGGAETTADEFDVSAVVAAVAIDLANLTNIESVVGDGINDSLIGGGTGNNWQITGVNSGSVDGIGFSGFSSITGGMGDDSFTFAGGALDGALNGSDGTDTLIGNNAANTFVITASDSGTATGIAGGFTSIETITGGSDTDSVTLNGGTLTGAFDGGAGDDALTLDDLANTIAITGMDSGTATGIAGGFTSVETIAGGGDTDTISLNGGSLSGTLTGGTGDDALALDNVANTIAITGTDSGTATGIAGGFTGVETITGGSDTDSITLNGGTLTGAFDGGAGDDALTLDDVANTITVTGADSGTATGVAGGFTDVETITGGSDTDSITLNGGTLTGALDTGAGDDTVTLDNVANTVTVTGADSGSATGIDGGFSAVENLTGGSDVDTVTLNGGTLSGVFDGGDGSDSLTADNIANTFEITGMDSGTATGIGGGFSAVENLTGGSDADTVTLNGGTLSGVFDGGDGSDSLTADNIANTFEITGMDSGTATGIGGGFSAVENLTGGSDADTVTLNGGTLSGVFDGGDGSDSLTADNIANTFEITGMDSGTATGIGGGFSAVENLIGGSDADTVTLNGGTLSGVFDGGDGSDSLTADNIANTFEITGTDSGSATGIGGGFSSIENIIGGSNTDSITLNGGNLTGAINGGDGSDTLTADNITNTFVVTGVDSGTVTGVGGSFSSVENLAGNDQDDTFTLDGGTVSGTLDGGDGRDTVAAGNVANMFEVTAANGGTVTNVGGGFRNIENLVGNAQEDIFSLTGGTLSGIIDGADGMDTLNADNVATMVEVTGVNSGTVTGVDGGFTNIETINGGASDDVFVFTEIGSVDGEINGGQGMDSVDIAGSNEAAGDNFSISGDGTRVAVTRTHAATASFDIGAIETVTVDARDGNDTVVINDLPAGENFDLSALTINAGNGDDTITISPTTDSFAPSLIVDGQNDNDIINVTGAITTTNGDTVTLQNAANVNITADITTAGALVVDNVGDVSLAADLQSTGSGSQLQLTDSALTLTGDSSLTLNDGDITLNQVSADTDAAHQLTINAGTGNITVTGDVGVGNGNSLGGLSVDTAGDVSFSGENTALNVGGDITITGNSLLLNSAVTTTNGGAITMNNVGTMNINSNVNSAGTVTLNGEGAINLDGDIVVTDANAPIEITTSTIRLRGDRVLSTNSSDITLDQVVNDSSGGRTLTLTAGAGNILIDDNVGTAGSPLGSLTVESANDVTFEGGGAAINADSLRIGNTAAVTGNVQLDAPVVARDTVRIQTAGGNVTSTQNAGVTDITLVNPNSSELNGGDVNGNLSISTSGGSITVGDIASSSTVDVNAGSGILQLNRRGNRDILVFNDQVTLANSGQVIAATEQVTITAGVVALTGAGSAPLVITQDGTRINQNIRSGNSLVFGSPFAVASDVARAIAGAVPKQDVDVPQEINIGPAEQEQLQQLGIYSRDLTPEETIKLSAGLGTFFNDIPSRSGDLSAGDLAVNMKPWDYKVAVGRLPGDLVSDALASYNAIFWKEVIDASTGEPMVDADGKAISENKASEVQEALQTALDAYKTKVSTQEIQPKAFRDFVDGSPDLFEARRILDQLQDLFRQVELLGLTPTEFETSKRVLLRPIKLRGMRLDELEKVIGASVREDVAMQTDEVSN